VLADSLLNHPPRKVNDISNFSDAIKEHTRQRLPRYQEISTIADWGAVSHSAAHGYISA